jgi:thioredoxin 1
MAVKQTTDATFKQDVLESGVPVVVHFWAPWCGPCKMVHPVMEELTTQYEGKAVVLELNTDDSPDTVAQYGIRSIPTLLIFKGGQRVDMIVGAVPKTTVANTLDKCL